MVVNGNNGSYRFPSTFSEPFNTITSNATFFTTYLIISTARIIPISSISLIGSLVIDWQVELSDSTSHTITDAYAGKEYIIQLAAKDMEVGTWSDWSVAVHATPWMEEPKPITSTTESDIIPGTLVHVNRMSALWFNSLTALLSAPSDLPSLIKL